MITVLLDFLFALLQTEIKAQKEELKKQREVLQKQTEMLREQGKLPKDPSLSRLCAGGSSSDTESTDSPKGHVQSQSDFQPGHKRSASAELTSKVESIKEAYRSDHKSLGPKTQSFSVTANKNMPVHLMSATNELKIGSKNVQQLPAKLSSAVSSSNPSGMGGTLHAGLSKLAPGIIAGGNGTVHTSLSSVHGSSSPSLTVEGGAHGDASNSQLGHSSSASHLGNHGNSSGQGQQNSFGSSVTVPMGNRQSNRPKPSPVPSPGISGLLRLAEKGDKKGKSSSSSQLMGAVKGSDSSAQGNTMSPEGQARPKSGNSQQRSPNISHKPQKSDSDVIYF